VCEHIETSFAEIWHQRCDMLQVNIAVACNLLQPPQHMEHIIVNKQAAPDAETMMVLFEEEMRVCIAAMYVFCSL
jgi:hypothetical protein